MLCAFEHWPKELTVSLTTRTTPPHLRRINNTDTHLNKLRRMEGWVILAATGVRTRRLELDCYVFIFSVRIAELFHCLNFPENTVYSFAELFFFWIFCNSCCHIWYQNGVFRDRDWFRSSSSSTPNISFFTGCDIFILTDTIKSDLLANIVAGHSFRFDHVC